MHLWEAVYRSRATPFAMAVASGILYALSFPDFNFYFLAWIALVPLLLVLPRVSAGRAALLGFVAGFAGFAGIVYWIYPTIYVVTYSPVQSLLCLALLGGYLALYVALWAAAMRSVGATSSVLRLSLIGGALWVGAEFLRSKMLNGFTWGFIGYSQADFKSLIQLASFGGVFFLSFLIVMANIAVAQFILTRRKAPLAAVLLVLSLSIVAGNALLRDSARRYLPSVVVAGLQGNVDQYKKFDDAYRDEIVAVYTRLARAAAKEDPAVIVWPETAVPGFLPDDPYLRGWIQALARETGTFQVVGAACSGSNGDVFNASVLVGPDGRVGGVHRKTHLVIFGEYVPLRKLLEPFFGVLNTIGELVPGRTHGVLVAGDLRCGPTICSENFFGDLVRRPVLSGAEVLVNQTNDAWYGRTSQRSQHFQMNILRAVENRRAVVVAANTGLSGIISPAGTEDHLLRLDTAGYFAGKVAVSTVITFYTAHGDLFAKACALASLAVLLLALLGRLNVQARRWRGKLFGGNAVPEREFEEERYVQ